MWKFTRFGLLIVLATNLALSTNASATPRSPTFEKRWLYLRVDSALDWTTVPVEPALGTIAINSKMHTQGSEPGKDHWPFLIDTTSACSWVASSNFTCLDNDGRPTTMKCRTPNLRANPEVAAATNATWASQKRSECQYPQRRALVSGTYVDMPSITTISGFNVTKQRLLSVDNFRMSDLNRLDRGFDDFTGNNADPPYGVFGFGQFPNDVTARADQYMDGGTPFMDAIGSRIDAYPLLSIAMPRDKQVGVVVIGGFPKNASGTATTKRFAITLARDMDRVAGNPFYGYAMPVEKFKLSDGKEDTLGAGDYIIDSLSPVIRTAPEFASLVAATFTPPANQTDIAKGGKHWYVACNATHSGGVGPMVASETFPTSNIDMVVKFPSGKCVSAFRPPYENDAYRLGWPFLVNTVVTLNFTYIYPQINVTQRLPPA